MKIDFVIGSLRGGGAERVVSTLANYLVSKQYEVRIITFSNGDAYNLNPKVKRIRLHQSVPFYNKALTRGLVNLLKFYRKKYNRPDIISSHIHQMGLITIPIAKLYGMKIIVSEHNNHIASKDIPLVPFLWRNFYPLADAITILTNYDWDFFKSKNKIVEIMPNPASFDKIVPSKKIERKDVILAIGDLNKYHHKGFDNLIKIMDNLLDKHPTWELHFIGDGLEGKEVIDKMILNSKIKSQIKFKGFRNDVDVLMKEASIFILPSRWEGLPMVLIEAASQGMCCIAYDCISGPSDIIINSRTGILVENQNIKKMKIELENLLLDKDKRDELGYNAINSVEKFSINNVGERWITLIKKINLK
ncbi:glycosyltransferase family 4 protein [Croceivirga sp. JEA036]|uniref:glycosyltransferase family 4 protein n=1 Tax=Croceivirga sp. JEA036 TaxID=2721162 RepID=UPI00143C9D83|nr:glycosyltransferase family 4 protein [Croceivirga sp. JEA036]NJB35364.1 glycosyltransferase family 4 protein [Croceivirga sp. JEA036]